MHLDLGCSIQILTQWTWVSMNSRSWWWTGRPGVLRFMGSQRVGHDWATDLIWSDPDTRFAFFLDFFFFFNFLTIWALSSLSRDPTCIPCLGSIVVIMGLPGKSLDFLSWVLCGLEWVISILFYSPIDTLPWGLQMVTFSLYSQIAWRYSLTAFYHKVKTSAEEILETPVSVPWYCILLNLCLIGLFTVLFKSAGSTLVVFL